MIKQTINNEKYAPLIGNILKSRINILLLIFFILNFLMTSYFMFYTFQDYLHSDAATKMLLANEILQTGDFLPKDWYYANNDIWFLFIHALLVPLIYFLGFNYQAYAFNALIYLIFFILVIMYFLKPLKISLSSKLLFLNLSLLSIYIIYAVSMFGELAYMPQVFFAFLVLGILIRFIDKDYLNVNVTSLMLFILIFIYTIHNPQRTLVYNLLPLLSILVLLYIKIPQYKKKNIKLIFTVLISFFIGVLVYKFFSLNLNNINGANNLMLANYDSIISNINIFLKGFLFTFGLVGDQSIKPTSPDGFIRLLNISFLIFLIFSIVKSIKINQASIIFMSIWLYFFSSFLLIIFLYLFTIPLAQNVDTFRYFYHLIIIIYTFILFYLEKQSSLIKNSLFIIIGIYILIINYHTYVNQYKKNTRNVSIELSRVMIDNNLSYGYASYWNSYINNVLSSGKVEVYPIHLSDGSPFRWLSSERWYNNFKDQNTFIIFTNQEFDQFAQSIFQKITPVKVLDYSGYKIAIFNYNISSNIVGKYVSTLNNGIDFTKNGVPTFIKSIKGISEYEDTHRWSEGKSSELVFTDYLPRNFILKIFGIPFKESIGKKMFVRIGDKEREIILGNTWSDYKLDFNDINSKSIVITYENPKSPFEIKESSDQRKLSFAYKFIKIEEIK